MHAVATRSFRFSYSKNQRPKARWLSEELVNFPSNPKNLLDIIEVDHEVLDIGYDKELRPYGEPVCNQWVWVTENITDNSFCIHVSISDFRGDSLKDFGLREL